MPHSLQPILPGATLGCLGGGQLGRMFAIAARQMGYRVHTFSPDTDTPAGQVADEETCADYADLDAVRQWASKISAATFEFENVPTSTAQAVADFVPVRPAGSVLHICQHRGREKQWLSENGVPCAPFRPVSSLQSLREALETLATPAILKSAGFGYDGKGQAAIDHPSDLQAAWDAVGQTDCVLEARVPFQCELSVVGARGVNGDSVTYAPFQNTHSGGILDITTVPADISLQTSDAARALCVSLMDKLQVVGVLCAELFLTQGNRLLVNELAPRPHNSGHLTIDAARTSQFGQQVRAVCALPLGSTDLLTGGASMANLLGDLWHGGEPLWPSALADPNISLHLYGKDAPNAGRKMGHITATAETPALAQTLARQARAALNPPPAPPHKVTNPPPAPPHKVTNPPPAPPHKGGV